MTHAVLLDWYNGLQEHGEPATLRRIGTPDTDVSVNVKIRKYKPEELAANVTIGEREAIISDKEIVDDSWPGPPDEGDKLIVGTQHYRIQAVDTLKDGATTIIHVLSIS